jgi:hypothetical protein
MRCGLSLCIWIGPWCGPCGRWRGQDGKVSVPAGALLHVLTAEALADQMSAAEVQLLVGSTVVDYTRTNPEMIEATVDGLTAGRRMLRAIGGRCVSLADAVRHFRCHVCALSQQLSAMRGARHPRCCNRPPVFEVVLVALWRPLGSASEPVRNPQAINFLHRPCGHMFGVLFLGVVLVCLTANFYRGAPRRV